jgi:hypothetical protein
MNHGKMTLIIASIVVVGAVTGVASAMLLQQALAFRHHNVFVLGNPGSSVGGVNGIKGGNGANGPSASGVNGNNADGVGGNNDNGMNANGANGNNTNGANG